MCCDFVTGISHCTWRMRCNPIILHMRQSLSYYSKVTRVPTQSVQTSQARKARGLKDSCVKDNCRQKGVVKVPYGDANRRLIDRYGCSALLRILEGL